MSISRFMSNQYAETLYNGCLAFFQVVSKSSLKFKRGVDQISIDEELGRLYLWGKGFRNGVLDTILNNSDDLKKTVSRFLVLIGSILFKMSAFREDINSIRVVASNIGSPLTSAIINEEESHSDIDSDDDSDQSENTAEASIESIQFYVGLLMKLVPSMDRLYHNLEVKHAQDEHFVSHTKGVLHDDVKSSPPPRYSAGTPESSDTLGQGKKSKTLSEKSKQSSEVASDSEDSLSETWIKDMQKRVIELLKIQRREILPAYVFMTPSSLDSTALKFRTLLHRTSEIPMRFEDADLLADALSLAPVDAIFEEAKELDCISQAEALSLGVETKKKWGYQDCVIGALLR